MIRKLIASVADEVERFAKKHEKRQRKHQNIETLLVLDFSELVGQNEAVWVGLQQLSQKQ